jgi:hypothetical protein
MIQCHQPPNGQGRRSRGRHGGGHGSGAPNGSGGGGYNGGGGGGGRYNGGSNNPPQYGGTYFPQGGGAYNGGGGNYNNPPGVPQPPSPVKRFENWNYCHTHGGNVDNNHTSASFARPGEHHQRAAMRSNTMNGKREGNAQDRSPQHCRPPPPTVAPTPRSDQLHPHLHHALRRRRPVFPHCPRQLGVWTTCGGLSTRQQHPSPAARHCDDGEHDGIQKCLSLPHCHTHHRAPTSFVWFRASPHKCEPCVVQQLLTVRGGQR